MDQDNQHPSVTPPALSELIDDAQLALTLGVTTRHLRTLRKQKHIPFVRLGRLIRYKPAAVAQALERLTVNARTN